MGPESQPVETIRVALVMNGGVSLAVWMGGVTHEIQRLLDASQDPGDDVSGWAGALLSPGDSSGTPRYRMVAVDYAAGTSAGGLNGAILATAVARGSRLPSLKKLWLEKGRLTVGGLIPSAEAVGPAVLDGDYFHAAIEDVIADVPINAPTARQMTLLVTATAMTGGQLKIEDANDHRIDVTDHRRVYKFESRDGDVGDFQDTATLARAGRASASFPVAFAPVRETDELARHRTPSTAVQDGPATWLIDGGVLDNAPFEPLLREIADHPRTDAGRRLIVYVVPYAAGFGGREPDDGTDNDDPPPWLSVVRNLGSLRGEADLRNDLAALRSYIAAARDVQHPPEVLIVDGLPMASDQVERLLPLYARTRATGFIRYLRETYTQVEKISADPIDDMLVSRVLASQPYFVPDSLAPTDASDRWQWGVVVARRLTSWMSRQARLAQAPEDVLGLLAGTEKHLKAINERIDAEYERTAYRNQQATYVLDKSAERVRAELEPVATLMSRAIAAWAGTVDLTAEEAWTRLAHVEVVTNFDEWHRRATPPHFDTVLVDTAEGSVGKFVLQDDPALARGVQHRPNKKLYGTRLRHFGSFGHESYRAHDWAWGRVDGALCLASALMKGVDGAHRDAVRTALVDGILAEEGLTRDAFVKRTAKVHGMSDTALTLDIIRRGEADATALIASIRAALLDATPGGGLLAWARRVAGLDGGSSLLRPVVKATEGLTGWLRDRASDVRELLDGKDQ
jgi:patatin-related protein